MGVPAQADSVSDFYDGKTITIVSSGGAGGSHGAYARLISAHIGSWETVARCVVEVSSMPFHVLAKKSRIGPITEFLEALRRRAGVEVLWVGRKSLLKEMLSALRRKEALGFVMDQKPENLLGPVVEFLGLSTEFVKGPAALAVHSGCPVIAVFAVRVGPFHYRLVLEEILPPGHGEVDEVSLTQRMAAAIERVVREHPEQWSWNYRRWRFAAADCDSVRVASGS